MPAKVYRKVISVGSLLDVRLTPKSVKYAAMPLCRGGRPRPPVSRHRRRASLVQREVVEEATADETGGIVIQ